MNHFGIAAIILAACCFSTMLLWVEIIGRVNATNITPQIEDKWGRKSFSETWRIIKLHRQHYPQSQLRKLVIGSVCLVFAAWVFVAIEMFSV